MRDSKETIVAKILKVSCRWRHKGIELQVGKNVYWQKIQISDDACAELSNQQTIMIKMDTDENIIFADERYNTRSLFDLVAFVLVFLFALGMIVYFGIIPVFKE